MLRSSRPIAPPSNPEPLQALHPRSRVTLGYALLVVLCAANLGAQTPGAGRSWALDPDAVEAISLGRHGRIVPEAVPDTARGPIVAADAEQGGIVTLKVFCDDGESIQDALQNPAAELRILVYGMCPESVEIRRDRVTLLGTDPSLDGIQPPADDDPRASALRIREARRVRVETLTLSGAAFEGLRVLQSTDDISLHNVVLRDNAVRGGTILDSIVTMEGVEVTGNGASGDPGVGLGGLLTSGSTRLICSDCEIHSNPAQGENPAIRALRGSQVHLHDSYLDGSQAVRAHGASVFVVGGWLQGSYAALADDGSRVLLTELSFEGTLRAHGGSELTLGEVKQGAAPQDNMVTGGSMISLETPRPGAPLPTSLARPIWLSRFARAMVADDVVVPGLECSLGADAVCMPGAVVGASTCGQCPQP